MIERLSGGLTYYKAVVYSMQIIALSPLTQLQLQLMHVKSQKMIIWDSVANFLARTI